jgi:hypothetical protein
VMRAFFQMMRQPKRFRWCSLHALFTPYTI